MRLYINRRETEILLDALGLLKLAASEEQWESTENTCDVLIARITDCKELQIVQAQHKKIRKVESNMKLKSIGNLHIVTVGNMRKEFQSLSEAWGFIWRNFRG